MKQLLRRLHLITPFTLELPIGREEFVRRLQQHVAPPNTNPFGWLSRLFSSTVAPYTGVVEADFFRLKPRIESNQAFTFSMEGRIVASPAGTRLEAEVNGASGLLLAFALFYALFPLIGLVSLATQGRGTTLSDVLFFLLVFLLQGGLVLGIPYILVRRRMQKAAYELERDLFYFVQRPERA